NPSPPSKPTTPLHRHRRWSRTQPRRNRRREEEKREVRLQTQHTNPHPTNGNAITTHMTYMPHNPPGHIEVPGLVEGPRGEFRITWIILNLASTLQAPKPLWRRVLAKFRIIHVIRNS